MESNIEQNLKSNMEKIRLGIIGMGNMGSGHFRNVQAGKCPSVKVTAVCDINPEKLKDLQDVACFTDADKMLESGLVDAVLIAVPHYLHPDMAIKAFNHKIHVLTEKPAGVYARQVREMNEAAAKSGVKFGIMFNQRTNPLYAKAREIVQSGQLGELKRFVWIITNWSSGPGCFISWSSVSWYMSSCFPMLFTERKDGSISRFWEPFSPLNLRNRCCFWCWLS